MKETHLVVWQDDSNDLHIKYFDTQKEMDEWIGTGERKCIGVSGQYIETNDSMSC